MRLAVCGSRTLSDERVKIILLEEIEKNKISTIVTHAEPEGVCNTARKLAKELGMPLHLHHLNFKYLRGAFEHRSKAVFEDCDRCVYIHDGNSQGTANEIKLGSKMAIPGTVHVLKPSIHKKSVGFDIDTSWADNIDIDGVLTDA
jgi:hypothetical protein